MSTAMIPITKKHTFHPSPPQTTPSAPSIESPLAGDWTDAGKNLDRRNAEAKAHAQAEAEVRAAQAEAERVRFARD